MKKLLLSLLVATSFLAVACKGKTASSEESEGATVEQTVPETSPDSATPPAPAEGQAK